MSPNEWPQTTQWSLVLAARARDEPGSREALSAVCERYWYPAYVLVRRLGYGPEEAADLTQSYFLKLLERDFLGSVRPEAGRFRSFLLASIKHHVANERRHASAQKRGGGRAPVSLDADDAERRFRDEPREDETPERAYEQQWALAVLGQARERLRRELIEAGRERHYDVLAPFLSGTPAGRTQEDAASELGVSVGAVKMALTRLRRAFGRALRAEIAEVSDDVDTELRYLQAILRDA